MGIRSRLFAVVSRLESCLPLAGVLCSGSSSSSCSSSPSVSSTSSASSTPAMTVVVVVVFLRGAWVLAFVRGFLLVMQWVPPRPVLGFAWVVGWVLPWWLVNRLLRYRVVLVFRANVGVVKWVAWPPAVVLLRSDCGGGAAPSAARQIHDVLAVAWSLQYKDYLAR